MIYVCLYKQFVLFAEYLLSRFILLRLNIKEHIILIEYFMCLHIIFDIHYNEH